MFFGKAGFGPEMEGGVLGWAEVREGGGDGLKERRRVMSLWGTGDEP